MKNSPARRAAFIGLLFSLALVFSVLEGWVAPLFGLPPGVKPGLANIVVLYALLYLPRRYALALVLLKTGFTLAVRGVQAGALSLAGGLFSLAVMLILLLPRVQASVFLASMAGAVSHNAGQLLVISLWLGPLSLYYMAVLFVSGLAMGALTAATLRLLLPALEKAGPAPFFHHKNNDNLHKM